MSGGIVFEDMHNRESAFGKLGQTFRHIRYKQLATAKIYFWEVYSFTKNNGLI